ncbi:MAG: FAD-dependent oxidoreductase [Nitrososphaeria archaeon]|jgi:glycerol-3-phosphate dehydrogenase
MPDRVIVVGAGITGSFAALDMALRGADVVLVEEGGSPRGATASIAGVIHGGARFAVTAPMAAAVCRDENPLMLRIARDFIISDRGYFLVADWTQEDYIHKFESSTKELGIYARPVEPPVIDSIRPGILRSAFETSDAVIDLQEFTAHLIWRAVAEGVEYSNSSRVTSARYLGDHEWELSVRRRSSERVLRGALIIAAGHGIPVFMRDVLGIDARGLGVARGSHAVLKTHVPAVLQVLGAPGIGDLFAPARGMTLVGPTLVPGGRPGAISDEERSSLIAAASRVMNISKDDVIGWSSTGRLTFDAGISASPPDLVAEIHGAVVAYSANMTCGRRTAEAASDMVAGWLGLGRGNTRDIVVEREGPIVEAAL